jgi:AraC-like DNA-binding protein
LSGFGKNERVVNLICEYLIDNFDKNISLAELSHIAKISPFYLTRIFSDAVGVPPHLFQNLIRINKAKQLLKSCKYMTDVAILVGFSDQSHFIRKFKKIVGMTPKEYKKAVW